MARFMGTTTPCVATTHRVANGNGCVKSYDLAMRYTPYAICS